MPSTAVETRSVSPCTVLATEKAIAESASDSHSTASSALPRLSVGVVRIRKPVHMDLRRHGKRTQTRNIVVERRHLDPYRGRPSGRRPQRAPLRIRRRRRLLLIRETAQRQPVRQHERARADLDRTIVEAVRARTETEEARRDGPGIELLVD